MSRAAKGARGGWSARIILALCATIVGLLACEATLALVRPQLHRRPPVWQFDRELGWSHIPGSRGRLTTPEFDVDYVINSEGMRDREPGETSSDHSVLLFGDSFAEGWGVELDETTGELLEVDLNESGCECEVINYGTAGFGTDQQLLLYERSSRKKSADVVLVLFYGNDLWNNYLNRGIGAERGFKPRFRLGDDKRLRLTGVPVEKSAFWSPESPRPLAEQLRRYLFEHWHLIALVRKAMAAEIPPRQQRDFYGALYGDGVWSSQFDKVWRLTAGVLAAFAEQVGASGARMLLVYAPSIVQIEEENWRSKRTLHGLLDREFNLEKPNLRLSDIAATHGVDLLDLTPSFAVAASRQRLFFDDSHWNPAGHRVAATAIREYLLAHSWLK